MFITLNEPFQSRKGQPTSGLMLYSYVLLTEYLCRRVLTFKNISTVLLYHDMDD